MDFKLKKDKYKSTRGGNSKLLDLFCRECETFFMVYQKDGSGNLRRLYADRIFFPYELTNLQNKPLNLIPTIKCPKCKINLATPFIYQKENRIAFNVDPNKIIKKIRKDKEDSLY
jgi:hypothetical protein